jgi:outer membrane protein OmpA-like peptidoglycan-associated protein
MIRLEQISGIVNQYKTLRFDIEGHTDSTGSDKINDKLSQARADAVRDYLVEKGFPADLLTSKGFGSKNPIGDNNTRQGRQQNRRVEIFSEYAEK